MDSALTEEAREVVHKLAGPRRLTVVQGGYIITLIAAVVFGDNQLCLWIWKNWRLPRGIRKGRTRRILPEYAVKFRSVYTTMPMEPSRSRHLQAREAIYWLLHREGECRHRRPVQ